MISSGTCRSGTKSTVVNRPTWENKPSTGETRPLHFCLHMAATCGNDRGGPVTNQTCGQEANRHAWHMGWAVTEPGEDLINSRINLGLPASHCSYILLTSWLNGEAAGGRGALQPRVSASLLQHPDCQLRPFVVLPSSVFPHSSTSPLACPDRLLLLSSQGSRAGVPPRRQLHMGEAKGRADE